MARKYPHGTAQPLSGQPGGLSDISGVPRTLQGRDGWRGGGRRGSPAWQRSRDGEIGVQGGTSCSGVRGSVACQELPGGFGTDTDM